MSLKVRALRKPLSFILTARSSFSFVTLLAFLSLQFSFALYWRSNRYRIKAS